MWVFCNKLLFISKIVKNCSQIHNVNGQGALLTHFMRTSSFWLCRSFIKPLRNSTNLLLVCFLVEKALYICCHKSTKLIGVNWIRYICQDHTVFKKSINSPENLNLPCQGWLSKSCIMELSPMTPPTESKLIHMHITCYTLNRSALFSRLCTSRASLRVSSST